MNEVNRLEGERSPSGPGKYLGCLNKFKPITYKYFIISQIAGRILCFLWANFYSQFVLVISFICVHLIYNKSPTVIKKYFFNKYIISWMVLFWASLAWTDSVTICGNLWSWDKNISRYIACYYMLDLQYLASIVYL